MGRFWAQRRRDASIARSEPDRRAVDYGLTDIVTSRYNAGVRLGEQVARGMIAVPISPDMRMAAVASPAYFEEHEPPKKPQDLTKHCCINIRLPTSGGVYDWELELVSR